MKWFKHDTDMCLDLKIREVIHRHGAEGYAIWCLMLELVGREGNSSKVQGTLRWSREIAHLLGWRSDRVIVAVAKTMAELELIDSKSFKYGHLHIPKMEMRVDTYTARKFKQCSNNVRTNFEQTSNNVRVDKTKTRREKNTNMSMTKNCEDITLHERSKKQSESGESLISLSKQNPELKTALEKIGI
jgi:hypothetical protein